MREGVTWTSGVAHSDDIPTATKEQLVEFLRENGIESYLSFLRRRAIAVATVPELLDGGTHVVDVMKKGKREREEHEVVPAVDWRKKWLALEQQLTALEKQTSDKQKRQRWNLDYAKTREAYSKKKVKTLKSLLTAGGRHRYDLWKNDTK